MGVLEPCSLNLSLPKAASPLAPYLTKFRFEDDTFRPGREDFQAYVYLWSRGGGTGKGKGLTV